MLLFSISQRSFFNRYRSLLYRILIAEKRKQLLADGQSTTVAEPKKKRSRTIYSGDTRQKLERVFSQTPYPDLLMREEIANSVGLTEARIHVRDMICET